MMVDERSDAEVYSRYATDLVRFATGLVGPTHAPDVVADAFLRLMSSRVWTEAADRRALLYRAVTFEARLWFRSEDRRRRRDTRVAPSNPYGETPSVEPEVWLALKHLSEQQRAVVFLTYWDDLDPAAIGSLLGVSEGTVRKQLARGREQLRKVLR
jgi:RNA polymerase sigma-70 factor (ECF subfamily)